MGGAAGATAKPYADMRLFESSPSSAAGSRFPDSPSSYAASRLPGSPTRGAGVGEMIYEKNEVLSLYSVSSSV